MYAAANRILGNIVKVTPSSKVVGDLALALVGANADPAQFEADPTRFDIPDSVIGFLNGDLGDPPGGWPEPFRTKALEGRTRKPAVSDLSQQDEADLVATPRRTLNRLLFPGPTRDFEASRETYSDLSVLGTGEFLHGLAVGAEHEVDLEPGKRLLLGVQSISDPDERGLRTVMCTVNGQLRPVRVRDESVRVDVRQAERADPAVAGPGRGAVRRGDLAVGGRGRHRRGRRPGGDDRGDEDGGGDHLAGRRHGAAAGHRQPAAGRGRRPAARRRLTTPVTRSWSRRPRHRRRRNRHRRSRCRPTSRGWR